MFSSSLHRASLNLHYVQSRNFRDITSAKSRRRYAAIDVCLNVGPISEKRKERAPRHMLRRFGVTSH